MGGHVGMGMGGHVGPPRRVEMGGGQSRGGQSRGIAPTEVSLSEVVQWFKTMTTNEYIRGVKQSEWQPFPGRLWQRNYYEHIIRNEIEWNQIREYIQLNPMRWQEDELHPYTPSNAKSGEIAHINRSKPHSGEREEAGQGYYTSSVRHGPGSAQFSLRITEQR